jgi:hypothetical protein
MLVVHVVLFRYLGVDTLNSSHKGTGLQISRD